MYEHGAGIDRGGREKKIKKIIIERSCSARGPPQMCTVGTDRVGCEKKIRGGERRASGEPLPDPHWSRRTFQPPTHGRRLSVSAACQGGFVLHTNIAIGVGQT